MTNIAPQKTPFFLDPVKQIIDSAWVKYLNACGTGSAGIANFDIDITTLADGGYWGSALIGATVDSTVVAGDVLYLKSNGNYAAAKADVYGTNPVSAMALSAGTGKMNVLQWGIVNLASTPPAWAWTPGNLYLDYTTAGAMTQEDPNTWEVAGYQSQIVGIALTATIVKFFPNWPMAEVFPPTP